MSYFIIFLYIELFCVIIFLREPLRCGKLYHKNKTRVLLDDADYRDFFVTHVILLLPLKTVYVFLL